MPECAEAIHPFGGLANTGSALNIRIVLRSSAADCFSRIISVPYTACPASGVGIGLEDVVSRTFAAEETMSFSPTDLKLLATLVPIDALSAEHLRKLADKAVIEDLPSGQVLFEEGSTDSDEYY